MRPVAPLVYGVASLGLSDDHEAPEMAPRTHGKLASHIHDLGTCVIISTTRALNALHRTLLSSGHETSVVKVRLRPMDA